jgi:hypothetical protein
MPGVTNVLFEFRVNPVSELRQACRAVFVIAYQIVPADANPAATSSEAEHRRESMKV